MRPLLGTVAAQSYIAADTELGLVDLHILPSNEATRDVVLALSAIAHPNLARMRDAGVVDEEIYLVEDHIEGVSLKRLLEHQHLPGDVTLHLVAVLASSLAEAEQLVQSQPQLAVRVPQLQEIFVSAVGQIKMGLTAVIALPSSVDTVIDVQEAMTAAAVAQASGRPLAPRTAQALGPAAGIGILVETVLGPRQPDEDTATRAARDLAEVVTRGQGRPGDCRALHALAVSALRQAVTTPTGGFVFRKLSDLVEQHAPRAAAEEADTAAQGALLVAALPDGTPRARLVHSWYYDLPPLVPENKEDNAPLLRVRRQKNSAAPAMGVHTLGQQLAGTPYRLLRKLGIGGMGLVFEAEHVDLNRRVALKVLHATLNRDPQVLARFRQEARSAARIRHPHVVEIYDFGSTSAGEAFLVMELLEGQSLTRVCRSGPMPVERAVEILCQVSEAVEAAHQAGVIHRDLKPDNVMIVPHRLPGASKWPDMVKVLDFGIAKLREQEGLGPRDPTQTITKQGQLFGTPEYMAPEQILGSKTDHRVDIYALGCIAYELLTGGLPFTGENYGDMLASHIKEAPLPPSQRAPDRDIPAVLDEVVIKAMAKNPEQRYASMAEFGAALRAALTAVAAARPSQHPGVTPAAPATREPPGDVAWVRPEVLDIPIRKELEVEGAQQHRSLTHFLLWGGLGALIGLASLFISITREDPEDRSAAPSQTSSRSAERGEAIMQSDGERSRLSLRPEIRIIEPPRVKDRSNLSPGEAAGPRASSPPPGPGGWPKEGPPRTAAAPSELHQTWPVEKPEPARPAPAPAAAGPPLAKADPLQRPTSPPLVALAPRPEDGETGVKPPPAPAHPQVDPQGKPPGAIAAPAPRPPEDPRPVQAPLPPPTRPAIVEPPRQRFTGGRLSYAVLATTSAYGKRDVLATLDANRAKLEACYQQSVRSSPTSPPAGNGTLSFAINEDGNVMSGRSYGSGAVKGLRACLEQVLLRTRFARPEIGPVVVTLQIDMVPLP